MNVGVGVQPIIAHHDLAFIRDMQGHPGIKMVSLQPDLVGMDAELAGGGIGNSFFAARASAGHKARN
jgi:hypothetical protein